MPGIPSNSMNLNSTVSGLVNWDGISIMSSTPLTTFSTLTAASSNTINNVSPGTTGQVLTSNGPTSHPTYQTSGSSPTLIVTGILTNSQIKNLNGTPVTVLPAPGAGKWYQLITFAGKLIYGGTTAFTAAVAQTISIYQSTSVTMGAILIQNIILTGTATTYNTPNSQLANTYTTAVENQPLILYNPVATEISGDAANDSTVTYSITYQIINI